MWDFGSGQLYKKYPDEQTKKRHEDTVTGLAYHTIYNKRCLLVSSWGNKIRIMEVRECFRQEQWTHFNKIHKLTSTGSYSALFGILSIFQEGKEESYVWEVYIHGNWNVLMFMLF